MRRIYFLSAHAPPSLPADRFTVASGLPNVRSILAERAAITAFAPDVLHAVGPAAVRFAYALLATMTPRPKFVASEVEPIGNGFIGWLTRRALSSADRIVTETEAAAERVRKSVDFSSLPLGGGRVGVGVTWGWESSPPTLTLPHKGGGDQIQRVGGVVDIPPAARLIVCESRFDSVEPALTAAWAFDVLKYAVPDVYLVLVGDGPARDRVERFARGIAYDDYRVRFALLSPPPLWGRVRVGGGLTTEATPTPTLPPPRAREIIASADIVWATEPRGVRTLLTAMAAGKPIVAVASPDLMEVAGTAARFAPVGDKIALAAATRELLADPAAASALGAAAASRAGEFDPAKVAERWADIYDELFRG